MVATSTTTPEKSRLHPRNRNREPYHLQALLKVEPSLSNYIKPNKFGGESIDFAHPTAVKLLNKALLHHYYGMEYWDFPAENLCPPIPGRADYLHYIADLLALCNEGVIPTGAPIKGLDIGVGASCIYPIIGTIEYGWKFVGSDINAKSIASSKNIISANTSLKNKIDCRLQKNEGAFFKGILKPEEYIDFSVCNPPFHTSTEEAQKGTQRKLQNLAGKRPAKTELNFAGVQKELVYEGGELAFIRQMIQESKRFEKQCFWFTTLVAKEMHLKGIYKALEKIGAQQVQTIPMGTGNKISRIVAWTFLTEQEQIQWKKERWEGKKR